MFSHSRIITYKWVDRLQTLRRYLMTVFFNLVVMEPLKRVNWVSHKHTGISFTMYNTADNKKRSFQYVLVLCTCSKPNKPEYKTYKMHLFRYHILWLYHTLDLNSVHAAWTSNGPNFMHTCTYRQQSDKVFG